MYIRFIDNKAQSYSVAQLRKDNPNISFPAIPSEECLAEWNVFPVEVTPAPVVDYMHVAFCAQIAELVEGKWVQVWSIRDATYEEWSQKTLDQAAAMRQERSALLATSDWTQVSDAPVDKAVWAIYRQALRDITTQQDFPWGIIWPVAPV